VAGIALIGWALAHSEEALSLGGMALALALLTAGGLILYSLWFLLAGLSIWFVKVWNATEVLRYTLVAGRYPISAYPPALRVLFTLVLPVAFLTTVPAEALLGRASAAWALGSLTAASISMVATRLFWQFALRHYTSASS
jgi:ABC-2 type transport system permease protein